MCTYTVQSNLQHRLLGENLSNALFWISVQPKFKKKEWKQQNNMLTGFSGHRHVTLTYS